MWQFVLAIEGMKDACEALNVPIVSGNVSFYNETNDLSIYPTPMIGMVGLIEQADMAVTQSFKQAGDIIILLGTARRPGWDGISENTASPRARVSAVLEFGDRASGAGLHRGLDSSRLGPVGTRLFGWWSRRRAC